MLASFKGSSVEGTGSEGGRVVAVVVVVFESERGEEVEGSWWTVELEGDMIVFERAERERGKKGRLRVD